MRAIAPLAAALALSALPFATRAQHMGHAGHCGHDHAQSASSGGSHDHATDARDAHEIMVTSDGFVPSSIRVKRGEPVKLVVTRKTDRTCAKEIVIEDYGINQALPLDTPVTIEFTPKKSGEVRYACAMDMIRGVLFVE